MKKIVYKGLTVFLYLLFLFYVTEFQLNRIFDAKSFIAVVIGMALLTLPIEVHKREKEEFFNALAWNAMLSGYIATIFFLLARIDGIQEIHELLIQLAMNCRPILYGTIIYTIFHQAEERKEPYEKNKVELHEEVSAEQIYFHFRSLGLTQREAEVARLVYNDLTNNEIASELYISETTVKKHMSNIFSKLEIERREQIKQAGWE